MIILAPAQIAAIAASRGTGAANLATPDPKEVWADSAAGGTATIDLDLGAVQAINTVFLGHVTPPAAGATWAVTAGAGGYEEAVLRPATSLRVPDVPGRFPATSHALWHGATAAVRYLRMSVTQPAGSTPLTIGVVCAGLAFTPQFNRELGSGRRPIDTGSSTALPSGSFAVVEGVRKRAFAWTFGDLSAGEVDQLDALFDEVGETFPGLVVEDPAPTPSLRQRIHYGLLRWRQNERRDARRTKWELEVEQWA